MVDLLHLTVWMVLLAGTGTNAARLYPANQQVNLQKWRNETRMFPQRWSLGQVSPLDTESGFQTEYVAAHQTAASDQGYYGVIATMDVYNFNLGIEQYTVGSIILFDIGDGEPGSYSTIQIGWEVSPKMYGDSRTRLASLWMNDGLQETGCPNAQCAFQPAEGASMTLGGVIETVSQPKGLKQTITIIIFKDGAMGDWLVYYGLNQDDPALIGRFPRSLFTGGMANTAPSIRFGGYVQTHTTNLVPMGSGYLPTGDAMASAFMSNIQIFDQNGQASPLTQDSPTVVTDSNIYRATPIVMGNSSTGNHFSPRDVR